MALLGCIADTVAGAAELAQLLTQDGLRAELLGPEQTGALPTSTDGDCIVVLGRDLRQIAPFQAVEQAVAALKLLKNAGCPQFYFHCSATFDSTDKGNIGIIIDALMQALGSRFSLVCPANLAAAVTVFRGHLFVGNALLADSPMREHSLTPMQDANIVRVLQRQTARKVGLVNYETLAQGVGATAAAFAALTASGVQIAVADAIAASDFQTLAQAIGHAALPLLVGSDGLAVALAQSLALARAAPTV